MNPVYAILRKRLDDFASGYPATAGGVEIRLLKKLFTEEEAELFARLSPLAETPDAAARRLGRDPDRLAIVLERMAAKGLLFRIKKGDQARYAAIPFVPGIYDFQVSSMDPILAQDVQDYTEQGFGRTIQGHQTPIMRTIPIKRELVVQWPVAPYEDALAIVDRQKVIAVAPCICRKKGEMLERGCGKPLETCLMFGYQAHFYVDNGMGRYIDKAAAARIIEQSDAAGLVLQPFNARDMGVLCSCCGDCCEMLGSLKRQPKPAEAVKSNYYAQVSEDACSGCATCEDRCQMDAITVADDRAVVDRARCIGCGLCVTTCPTGAVALVKKDPAEQYRPPQNTAETFMRLAVERNKTLLPASPAS